MKLSPGPSENSSAGIVAGSVIGGLALVCCVLGIIWVVLALCCVGGGVTCTGCIGIAGISVGGTSLASVFCGGSSLVGVLCSGSGAGFLCCRFCRKRREGQVDDELKDPKTQAANSGEILFAEKQEKDPNFVFDKNEEMTKQNQ